MNFLKNLFKKTITKVISISILVLVLLSVFIFWGWYGKQINKLRGYYFVYKGDKFYKAHRLQKAINSYNRGLMLYPEHSKARCNLGNIYVIFEDFNSATEAYTEALTYNPSFIRCRINLGIIESEKMHDYDKAIQQYDIAIKSRPFPVYIPFVFNNLKTTKENKGIASYNKGLAFRGKSIFMGEDSFISGAYLVKAELAYKEALKILKKNFDVHYNLALTNHLLGDYKEAGLEYCKAINLQPMNYEAHYNLAILLYEMKMYKDSIPEFEKAGIILDAKGDTLKTEYIYYMLSETNRIISYDKPEEAQYAAQEENTKNVKQEEVYPTLSNGKVVVDTKDNKDHYKYFRICPTKKFFEDYELNG